MGHSYEQGPIHAEPDQKAMVARSLDVIERFCGKRPVGWLGPGLTETLETPEILAEAGIKYIGDWVYDDEPTTIRTAAGPLVTLPYTLELNDIPMMIVQHHESDYLLRRAIDQFDRLYAEGEQRAKIFALAIHPYISGQPHRIKYLEAIYEHARRFDGVLYLDRRGDSGLVFEIRRRRAAIRNIMRDTNSWLAALLLASLLATPPPRRRAMPHLRHLRPLARGVRARSRGAGHFAARDRRGGARS